MRLSSKTEYEGWKRDIHDGSGNIYSQVKKWEIISVKQGQEGGEKEAVDYSDMISCDRVSL